MFYGLGVLGGLFNYVIKKFMLEFDVNVRIIVGLYVCFGGLVEINGVINDD